MNKHCGYIALVGAPNAGKSTLLNALLRRKISIVSNKPQTTRTRLLGIVMREQKQMIFLDTPGCSAKAKNLVQASWDACEDADIICYLVDLTRGWRKDDTLFLEKLKETHQKKLFVLGTKSDKLKKMPLSKMFQEFQAHFSELNLQQATLEKISAKKPEDLTFFLDTLAQYVPESEWYYEPDQQTDSSETFICSEFIREQLFRQLGEELPYQLSVLIEHFEKTDKIVKIHAIIKVVRESQKSIIIGRGGTRLKAIGQMARESLENYFNQKVFLKIFVKKGEV